MIQRIRSFIKQETVLVLAFILALCSCFIVHPDKEYISYIDTHTILILFCLMAVMAGLQQMGVFRKIAEALLMRVKKIWQLVLILVILPTIH